MQSPTQPTATLTSVTVTGNATASATFQLGAIAVFSDGARRDITTAANWESSNTALATVSSAGVVTVVGSGQVEFRATYQAVTGRLQLLVSPAPAPTKYMLSGIVREAGTRHVIAGARLLVEMGPDAGAFAISDDGGLFTFPSLSPATIALVGFKDGYQTARVTNLSLSKNTSIEFSVFLPPPLDANGLPATGRCNDGSWTWAQTGGRPVRRTVAWPTPSAPARSAIDRRLL